MISFTVNNKTISFTAIQQNPVTFTTGGSRITFSARSGTINISAGLRAILIELSQINIDNKYFETSELGLVSDKKNIIIFEEVSGHKFEYGEDYNISGNRMNWNGYNLDGQLKVNDKIKIYY